MSKRGISRASKRVRLAVAAAVLAGGGAAGVVAMSASHSGPSAAESAGFIQSSGRTMSYTSAVSSAMKTWNTSPGTSLMTISHMKPVVNYWTQSWHRTTIFIQRGTVVAVARGEFAVESTNGKFEIWHVNRKTETENVGSTATGLAAMTGGTTRVPSWWSMNARVKGVAKGDLVFIFGERENHTLKAQLVLFAAPMATVTPTPTATMPTATPTATMPMVTPTATATAPTAPAAVPSGTASTFSGTHS